MQEPKITTLSLQDDYSGPVVATLIEYGIRSPTAVLYIHGFIDYFFQDHVARHFNDRGYAFFALDLRKCGRSYRDHQKHHYIRSLDEYFEEIDRAILRLKKDGYQKVILLGHSMGGLLTTHYVHHGKERASIDGMILNAPFFDFKNPPWMRDIVPAITGSIAKFLPWANVPKAVHPHYPMSIHKDHHGEWDFDLAKKPIDGFPAYFSFLSAIRKAQKWVMNHAQWDLPILVLASDASFNPNKKWDERMHHTDAVLHADEIVAIAEGIGSKVEVQRIPRALHDVFLSKKEVRDLAFEVTFDWMQRMFPFTV